MKLTFFLYSMLFRASAIIFEVRNNADLSQANKMLADCSSSSHTIRLHPGTYESIVISNLCDSSSIVFEGVGDEPSIISGAKYIPNSAWIQESEKLISVNLYDYNFTADDLGTMVTGGAVSDCQHNKTDLIFNDEIMTLARYPNIDVENNTWEWVNIDNGTQANGDNTSLTILSSTQPDLVQRIIDNDWASESDPWIHSYTSFDWTDEYLKIDSVAVDDTQQGITLRVPEGSVSYGYVGDDARFYGVNLLREVDQINEYHIDLTTGKLTFYPPVPFNTWKDSDIDAASMTADKVAMDASNAKNAVFRNLVITGAREICLNALGVTNVTVDNVKVVNCGHDGISIDGDNYVLINSETRNTGCVGVRALGGDPANFSGGHNRVENNTMSRNALWKRTYMPGLEFGGYANEYIGNHVSDGPHNCATGGGNTHFTVETKFTGNTFENCAYEASDTGGFYSCGQSGAWTNRGNVATLNTFSNIKCKIEGRSVQGCGGGVSGAYLDDQMSGWLFDNNTFENCDTGVLLGGGRDNHFSNNHFSNNSLAIHFDNRGMNWENAACLNNGTYLAEVNELLAGDLGSEWKERYPEMVSLSEEDRLCTPVDNIIENNTYTGCENFMDASDDDINSWGSTVVNNNEI